MAMVQVGLGGAKVNLTPAQQQEVQGMFQSYLRKGRLPTATGRASEVNKRFGFLVQQAQQEGYASIESALKFEKIREIEAREQMSMGGLRDLSLKELQKLSEGQVQREDLGTRDFSFQDIVEQAKTQKFKQPPKSVIKPVEKPKGFLGGLLFSIEKEKGFEETRRSRGDTRIISGAKSFGLGAGERVVETGIFGTKLVTSPITTTRETFGSIFGLVKEPSAVGRGIGQELKRDPSAFFGGVAVDVGLMKGGGLLLSKTPSFFGLPKFTTSTLGQQQTILQKGGDVILRTDTTSKVVRKNLFSKDKFLVDTKQITRAKIIEDKLVLFTGKTKGQFIDLPSGKTGLIGIQDLPKKFQSFFAGGGFPAELEISQDIIKKIKVIQKQEGLATLSVSAVGVEGEETAGSLIGGFSMRKGDRILSVGSSQQIKFSTKELDVLKLLRQGKGISSSNIKVVDKIIKKFEVQGDVVSRDQLLAKLSIDNVRALNKLQTEAVIQQVLTPPPSIVSKLIAPVGVTAEKLSKQKTIQQPQQENFMSLLTGQSSRQTTILKDVQKQDSALSLISGLDTKTKTITKTPTAQLQTPSLITKTKQRTSPLSAVGLISGVKTAQKTRTITGFSPFTFGGISIVTPTKTKKGFKPVIPQGEESDKKVWGYNVFVKSRGKFRKANVKPRSKQTALSIGANITDHSLARTFKVVKTNKKIKPKKKQPKYFSDNQFKFRTFKQKRGKKIPITNTFIEFSKYSIDKPQEKKISAMGLIAKRRNALSLNQPKRNKRKSFISKSFGI